MSDTASKTSIPNENSTRTTGGLVEVAATDDMAWFKTHGHNEHHVVRLHKRDGNCVEVIALAADSRVDVDALHGKVSDAGCRIVHGPREIDGPWRRLWLSLLFAGRFAF